MGRPQHLIPSQRVSFNSLLSRWTSRWYLVGSAEMGGGSKTLLQPSSRFFAAPKTIIIRELCSQWNIQTNLHSVTNWPHKYMHSMTTTSWLVGTSFSELKCSSICFTLELKTVHIELTAVEILEGLDIFPQTIDYWRHHLPPQALHLFQLLA